MMLKNLATGRWHPIMYVEKSFPSSLNEPQPMIRFKSKGHHTTGFENRDEAVASLDDLKKRMIESLFLSKVTIDITDDIGWEGNDLPLDIQLRLRSK